MKNLIRIMLEGAYGNFKRIFFASDRVTDMKMRKAILGGTVKPTDKVAINACIGCGGCSNTCPTEAITMVKLKTPEHLIDGWVKKEVPEVNSEKCVFCYYCHDFCPVYALFGEKATIHPNDVGKVKIDLKKAMDKPFKISDEKLSFISQFLSDKTVLDKKNSNKLAELHKINKN